MKKVFLYSTLSLVIVTLTKEIFSLGLNPLIKSFIALVLILSGLTFAKKFTRNLSIIALLVSISLGLIYKLDFMEIFKGIDSNIPIAVLFMTVPFISIPIRSGKYIEGLKVYFKRFSDSPNKFFSIVTFMTFSLGSVTSLAGVRVVNDILSDSRLPKKFLVRSYGTGFAGCMACSPYFPGVILAVTYGRVSFSEFFPFAFVLALIIMFAGLILFSFDSKNKRELSQRLEELHVGEGIKEQEASKKSRVLVMNLIILLILIIIGEKIIHFSNIIYLVSIVSLIYGLIWLYIVSPPTAFIEDLKSHKTKTLESVSEIVFFLSVGILARAIYLTPVKEIIKGIILENIGFHPFLMIIMIILSIVLLAVLGVHQIVSITIIGTILRPEVMGISPISYTIILSSAYMLSALSSPFGPLNMILSGVIERSTFAVAFRYNILFKIIVLFISGTYAFLLI